MKAWNGYIMVADIVGFSECSQREQVRMVQHLLTALSGDPFVEGRQGEPSYLNSTGDGFVYATSSEGDLDLPIQFADLAARLVVQAKRFAGAKGRVMEIRVGLHFGSLTSDVTGKEGGFSVGGGLNWCARICDLAGPTQILASEELVQEIVARVDVEAIEGRLHPPTSAPPFSIQVKHNRTARLRALIGDGLSDKAPPRLARAEQIGRHLEQALEIIAESIVAALRTEDESLESAARRLNPRLSVWVPNADGQLHALRPRVVLPKSELAPTAPARTVWGTSSPPTGPVSAAFISRRSVCLLDLPDPSQEPSNYAKAWSACNVPPAVVGAFSRHARAFMAVPLVLFEEPAGVLCVDLMDPLTGCEPLVDALMDTMQVRSGYFLTTLLHLRAG